MASTGQAYTDFAIRIGVDDAEAQKKFAKLGDTVDATTKKWSSFSNIGASVATDVTGPLEKMIGALTPLNVGLAAAGTAMAGFGVATYTALSALRSGGEFNETRKGFESLAASAGLTGSSIVKSVNEIAGGTLSLREIMESSSKAIRAGFGEDQIETIYTFAKRFSEATGESFTGTAENIVKALQTGRTQSLKQYGIMLEDGASFSDAFAQITDLTKAFGGGAFNFGDIETALVKQLGNLADTIGATWNEMLGESVTGDALEKLVGSLTELVDMGPMIAESLGAPVISTLDALIETGGKIYDVYQELSNLLGVSFGDVIGTGAAIAVEGISYFFKVADLGFQAFAKYAELAIGTWSTLADVLGMDDTSASLDRLTEKIAGVRIETSGLDKAATGLYYGFDQQAKSAASLGGAHRDLNESIKDNESAQKKYADAIERAIDAEEDYQEAVRKAALADEDRTAKSRLSAKEREELAVVETEKKKIELEKQKENQSKADAEYQKKVSKFNEDAAKLQKELNETRYTEHAKILEKMAKLTDERNELEADRTRELAERDRKARADAIKAQEEQIKAEAKARQDALDEEVAARERKEKLDEKFRKAEELRMKAGVKELDEFAGAAKTARAAAQGIGDTTSAATSSATSSLVADAEKSRQTQSKIVESNAAVVTAINNLMSKGFRLGISVKNGTSELSALVRRMIEEAQILAEAEGATVAGV